jgi:hypothetical protein
MVNEIIIHVPTPGPKGGKAVVAGAEIKGGLVGVVQEYPIVKAMVYPNKEGDRRIEGVLDDGISKEVGVPVDIAVAFTIQVPRLFPQAYKAFPILEVLVGRNVWPYPGSGQSRFICIDGVSLQREECNGERIFLDGDV